MKILPLRKIRKFSQTWKILKNSEIWKARKRSKLLFAIWKRKNIKTLSNIENHENIQIIENMKTQNHEKILKKMENISITKIWVWRKPRTLLLLDPNLVKYLLWSITKKAKTFCLSFQNTWYIKINLCIKLLG